MDVNDEAIVVRYDYDDGFKIFGYSLVDQSVLASLPKSGRFDFFVPGEGLYKLSVSHDEETVDQQAKSPSGGVERFIPTIADVEVPGGRNMSLEPTPGDAGGPVWSGLFLGGGRTRLTPDEIELPAYSFKKVSYHFDEAGRVMKKLVHDPEEFGGKVRETDLSRTVEVGLFRVMTEGPYGATLVSSRLVSHEEFGMPILRELLAEAKRDEQADYVAEREQPGPADVGPPSGPSPFLIGGAVVGVFAVTIVVAVLRRKF